MDLRETRCVKRDDAQRGGDSRDEPELRHADTLLSVARIVDELACARFSRRYIAPMNDLPPLPPVTPGRYRHHKGGEYEVLGVVRHSETLEPMVLYRPLYGERGLWVRPHAMFFEMVESGGVRQPRFAAVTSSS
jgi:hypothetical protein